MFIKMAAAERGLLPEARGKRNVSSEIIDEVEG